MVGEATVKFKCDLRDIRIILRVRVRAYYMYRTTAKFKSANIFILAARDQTAKFKDRQYFRLYGIFRKKKEKNSQTQRPLHVHVRSLSMRLLKEGEMGISYHEVCHRREEGRRGEGNN